MNNTDVLAVMLQSEHIQGAQYTVKFEVRSLGISLIDLVLGQFPFSEDQASDDSDLEALQSALSPSNPLFSASTGQRRPKEGKERRWKSIGVSL